MMDRNTRKRCLHGALTLALAFFMASGAVAGDAKRKAPQTGVVASIDAAAGTITLGNTTYRVGEKTKLFDVGGRPISLRELSAEGADFLVEYRARRKSSADGRRELRRLQMVEGDFE